MGASTCQHCGSAVDVLNPGKPWACPDCGRVAGPSQASRVATVLGGTGCLLGIALLAALLGLFVWFYVTG